MINISSKTLEDEFNTYNYMQTSKTQDEINSNEDTQRNEDKCMLLDSTGQHRHYVRIGKCKFATRAT
jgi:hypothetical protein